VRNGAPRSVAKGRRGMTNEATPAILKYLFFLRVLTIVIVKVLIITFNNHFN